MSTPATPATPHATHSRAPDLTGRALDGRYELHALIGEGAFGRVYRGLDNRLGRPVAVKVIKPWWGEDPQWVHGFEREAQLMARVSNPGIVQVFDVGHAGEGLYYVAELVDGESLKERLRHGPLPPTQARDVAEQLCRALGYAHAQRIVHRDIKPANVLISRQGAVKVGDFGVARLAETSNDALTATVVGTPKYMAPEQARGRGATPATDVYSVGAVLYEMLAGRPPFEGDSAVELALSHLHDQPPPLPPTLPGALIGVVERALAKDPADRYSDGNAMARALERARDTCNGHAETTILLDRAPDHGRAADSEPTRVAPRTASQGDSEPTRVAPPTASQGDTEPTRVAPPRSPRRHVDPAGGRRTVALFLAAILLPLAVVAGIVLFGGLGQVRVPDLRGMTKPTIIARMGHLGLRAQFLSRYSDARRDTAIRQTPASGTQVRDGSSVQVVLSAGPAPVAVPNVLGMSAAQADTTLAHLRLRATVHQVPAPGVAADQVTSQTPQAGSKLLPSSTVLLSTAEAPRWRTVTGFSGSASAPFKIRGERWRVVYRMSYDGTCTFIFFCSGPSATAVNLGTGATAGGFDLNEGDGQIWTFQSGPGVYQLRITPGSDAASWAFEVQDYY